MLGPDRCLAVGLRAPGLDADALALGFALLRRLVAGLRIRVSLLVGVSLIRVWGLILDRPIGLLGPDWCLAVGLRALGLDKVALARALEIALALIRALEIALLRRLVANLRIRVGFLVEVPLFRVRFRRFFRLILRFFRRWLVVFRVWSLPSLLGERALLLSPAVLAMPGE